MFKKYQHIERYGASKVKGIEKGLCYLFPKIDGTNGVVWLEDGKVKAGSRNKELTLEEDNRDFYKTISQDSHILEYLKANPTHRLFGEWLVPHTLKTYEDTAWNKFYVFDVAIVDEENDKVHYLSYEEYHKGLEQFQIEYIKPLKIVENPNDDIFKEILENNHYLIQENCGVGEGIVIKNYNFIYRGDNKQKWAKIVISEYKKQNQKLKHKINEENCMPIEERIIDKYCTSAFIEKEFAKMKEDFERLGKNGIPMLLNKVYYELINEEIWNIIKHFKNPTVDFKKLNSLVIKEIQKVLPEIFEV